MTNHDLPPSIAWIPDMIAAPFFAPCATHATGAKGEMLTLFSLRDRCSLCPVCAVERKVEHTVQVRRSSYHNVVRVQDVCKLIDVTGIQTYIINSARVVFLNERPHPRGGGSNTKGSGENKKRDNSRAQTGILGHSDCSHCHRILQSDNNSYCSISCKVKGGEDMLPKAGAIDFAYAEETIKPTPRKSSGKSGKSGSGSEKSAGAGGRGGATSPSGSDKRANARHRSPVSENSKGASVTVKVEDWKHEQSSAAHETPLKKPALSAKRKSSFIRASDAPVTPSLTYTTPSVHRRKSKPKKSPVG